MNRTFFERRKEQRWPAEGEVRLFLDGPPAHEVRGRLVDLSRGGFRAAHGFAGLSAGEELRFRHPAGRGRARVIWTRVLGGGAESGFLVLGL